MEKENTNPNHLPLKTAISPEKQLSFFPIQKSHNHEQTIFCVDCLQYNLTQPTLNQHDFHTILNFQSFDQSKQFTKELILNQIEITLSNLKRKENEIKNGDGEIQSIVSQLKNIQNSVVQQIHKIFQEIKKNVEVKYEQQHQKYQKQMEQFYSQHNQINQNLRQQILEIIDGNINKQTFSKKQIEVPFQIISTPKFDKFKSFLDKWKTYYKKISQKLKEVEKQVKEYWSQKDKFSRYDKYIIDKSPNTNVDYSSPLLRTLDIIQHNSCLPLIRKKVK